MKLYDNPLYISQLKRAAETALPWEKLDGSTLAVTGATGLLGRFLIDTIAYRNEHLAGKCGVLAVSRSEHTARESFAPYWDESWFSWQGHDVSQPFPQDFPAADFYIHAASNTHPLAYATDPVGTISANVAGTRNLLDAAARARARRFLFVSSVEIYGESLTPAQIFSENSLGYLDCNTLRAGYPESKRAGETLTQAYRAQYGMDCVTVRMARVFGPTVRPGDSKVSSQFLRCALAGRDIVMKSAGTQYYSYLYVSDAVTALLTVLLSGEDGQAYNAADPGGNVTLRDFAAQCARWAGTQVVLGQPDSVERAGYSKATRAILSGDKLHALLWQAEETLTTGVEKTLEILSSTEDAF